MINASISTFNFEGEKIDARYSVFVNGVKIREGQTSRDGATLEKFYLNKTIEVVGMRNGFYSDSYKFNSNENVRIDLILSKPGEFTFRQDGEISDEGDYVNLYVSSTDVNLNPHFCIDWSSNFYFLKVQQYDRVDITEFEDYNKCFSMGLENLNSTEERIRIDYKIFGSLDKTDYVRFIIFDAEKIGNQWVYNSTTLHSEENIINNV